MDRVVVLMPAYRAGKHVEETFHRIPEAYRQSVIIIDDASPDDTFEHARRLPAQLFRNERNLGYGGNMKVCFEKALATDAEIFVELHADGQYDPSAIPSAVAAVAPGVGIVLGSRFLKEGDARAHGMPLAKYVMNRILTAIANALLGTRLTEFHSGFHVYTRAFLETVNTAANSNDHLFSFEILLQALFAKFEIREIPIICAYGEGVTQMRWRKGMKYTREMLWALFRYTAARFGRRDPVFFVKTPKQSLLDTHAAR